MPAVKISTRLELDEKISFIDGHYLKFKGLHLSFSRSLGLAVQTLYGLGAKTGEGTFGARHYMASRRLGYTNLIENFLDIKRREVGYTQYKDMGKPFTGASGSGAIQISRASVKARSRTFCLPTI